ncbi:hypothetical protein Pla123a_24650 [Posidoniimonas polymericola]|uniref:IRE (Iron responsive element) n=1 Tax=Posidoniimonas polymericola TaxID=2528002 RepID=A0A5C5YQK9_9BACT|nr:hypothetical protein [Posidoniimonas polymericola]TWT77037.1 hypothetical protein Pla123a_24650 [Posidoniimonas polymericola]
MNERTNLYRKLAYAVAIAVVLFPLSILGSPSTGAKDSGGRLAEFRANNGLAQANLGDIDPASETIKLATLGLRGVAVNALWHKANQYKMKEDWGNLTATLEQLSKLQPNFITFWKYQAWNLTYNVSVEFDDYRDRYYYVRRGINFLKEGEAYNRDNPQILWELGWFIGQKIGRADEKEQYRRLFRTDETFHPEDRALEDRDNWLVSKEWYEKGERAAESRGIGRKSPIVFYSSAPKSQMNYAEAIETEGRFDRGLPAWRRAGEEWNNFGNLPIEHSTGTILQLNEEEELKEQVAEAREELLEIAPAVTGPLLDELEAKITPEQREAYETPIDQRSPEQYQMAMQVEQLRNPPPPELADLIATERPELRATAMRQLEKIQQLVDRQRKTKNYKSTANFDYWKLRCEFEQSADAISARRLCYQGRQAMVQDADPLAAKELYQQGLAKWRDVLDAYPELQDVDGTTGDDIMEFVKEYSVVLDKIDEEIPDDFPLWGVIENFDSEMDFEEELSQHRRRMSGEADPAAPEAASDDSAADEAGPAEAALEEATSDKAASGEATTDESMTESDASENESQPKEPSAAEADGKPSVDEALDEVLDEPAETAASDEE